MLVNFGDGGTDSATVGSGANFLPFHHTYADDGSYAASVTATGSVEGHTTSTDFYVAVADVPPDLRLGGNNYALRNVNHDVTLFHYDPGDDPLTSWHINWGDNSASDVAGTADHATHKYTTLGTYTVTASAFEDGAEWPVYAQGEFDVTVTNGTPDAPTQLKATALSRSKIQLAWKAPDAAETAGFKISYSADGVHFSPFATIANPNARAFTATNLDHLHPYTFSVSAYNDDGDSEDSDTASAATSDDEWQDQGAVTVDASGDMSYVNDDEEFPAADDYRLLYDNGAIQFDDPNYQNPAQFIAMNFIYGTAPDHLIGGQPYPGNQDGYYFQSSEEDAQYQATPTLWPLQHPGGKIGLQFDHDWLSDYTSGSTTWNLQRRIPHAGVQIVGDPWTKEDPDPESVHPATLMFNRDGREEDDLTLNFSLTGDQIEDIANQITGTLYYWTPDDEGNQVYHSEDYDIASGTVTIPAGTDYAFVDLYAIDDDTPEWTKELNIRLEDDDENYIANHQFDGDGVDSDGDGSDEDPDGTVYCIDNDPADVIIQGLPEETEPSPNEVDPGGVLRPNTDDDDNNGIIDGEQSHVDLSDDELEPVELRFPADPKDGTELTLSIDPATAASIRVWKDDGTQLLGVFGNAGNPVTSCPLSSTDGPSMTVYLEARVAAYTSLTLEATDSGPYPSSSSDYCNAGPGDAGEGDLDVATVSHNGADGVLDEDKEEKPGAFVPLNNDDDDYSAIGNDYGQDLSQPGAIAGEDDLLPIYVRAIPDDEANIKLTFAGVKVYRNADRTGPIDSGEDLGANINDETFYVEGTVKGGHTITLFVDGKEADRVKVTVFQWVGPLNVPQYGTYKYKVVEPPAGGKWLDPDGGSVEHGANTSDMDIFWAAGPQIGKAIYQPQENYTWDLEVNVVEVAVDAPDQGQAFTPGNVVDAGFDFDSAGNKMKLVKATGPGLTWRAKVTFNGPSLNGKNDRGVRQMRAGFVQNLRPTTLRGTYANNRTAKWTLEGNTYYWDTIDAGTAFYSTVPAAIFQDATPTNKTKLINSEDSPGWGPRTVFNGQKLASMQLVWDFRLYVVALTKDTRNAANQVYASQAQANWVFNGTGNLNNNFAWTSNVAAVTPPTAWGAVSAEPKTTGSRFNSIFRNAGWILLP